MAAAASALGMRPRPSSSASVTMKPNFSTIAGTINGRNRTGFDPISRNANCHASATNAARPCLHMSWNVGRAPKECLSSAGVLAGDLPRQSSIRPAVQALGRLQGELKVKAFDSLKIGDDI
jgi:hypothetical protein